MRPALTTVLMLAAALQGLNDVHEVLQDDVPDNAGNESDGDEEWQDEEKGAGVQLPAAPAAPASLRASLLPRSATDALMEAARAGTTAGRGGGRSIRGRGAGRGRGRGRGRPPAVSMGCRRELKWLLLLVLAACLSSAVERACRKLIAQLRLRSPCAAGAAKPAGAEHHHPEKGRRH